MTPGTYNNMTIYKGGTFTVELTGTDSVGLINFESVYDSALMHVQPAWIGVDDENLPEPLFELSTANGMITFDGTTIRLVIPASVTRTLTFASGVYSLKLIIDGVEPVEDILLRGILNVENGPTA